MMIVNNLWNAHDSVPLGVDCVLGVKLHGCVFVARQCSSVPHPLAAGGGLSSKPDVVSDGATLFECDVENTVSDNVRGDESVLGDHRLGGGSGQAGAALVDSPHSELILTTFNQTINFTLELVAHGLDLLDSQHLALHPLAHVLLLLLDDVVCDGGTAVSLWRSEGEVTVVWTPVKDIRFAARSRLI